MKLVIQIPCWNEELSLAATLADLPSHVPGVDEICVLIVDDGSTDQTIEVARTAGVDHVVRLTTHRGLAAAFAAGLDASLSLGADVIVNTDADNQYRGADIARLVEPILSGQAQMVVGDRQTGTLAHFSATKKLLQRVGSWILHQAADTDIHDATSGFRAYSREAALALNIFSDFSYTLETLIQAGSKGIAVANVSISVNPDTRQSRLVRSVPDYLRRSAGTIVRVYAMYKPLRVFSAVGSAVLLFGIALAARYLFFLSIGEGKGHLQSVVLAGVLLVLAGQMYLIALLAHLVSVNRRLSEDILVRLKKLQLSPSPSSAQSDVEEQPCRDPGR